MFAGQPTRLNRRQPNSRKKSNRKPIKLRGRRPPSESHCSPARLTRHSNETRGGEMTLFELLILLLIAGICGSLAQALVGLFARRLSGFDRAGSDRRFDRNLAGSAGRAPGDPVRANRQPAISAGLVDYRSGLVRCGVEFALTQRRSADLTRETRMDFLEAYHRRRQAELDELDAEIKTFEFKASNVPADRQMQFYDDLQALRCAVRHHPTEARRNAESVRPARGGTNSRRNWKRLGRICKTACNALSKACN